MYRKCEEEKWIQDSKLVKKSKKSTTYTNFPYDIIAIKDHQIWVLALLRTQPKKTNIQGTKYCFISIETVETFPFPRKPKQNINGRNSEITIFPPIQTETFRNTPNHWIFFLEFPTMKFSNVSKFFCNLPYIHELMPKPQNASENETLDQNKISILAYITERERERERERESINHKVKAGDWRAYSVQLRSHVSIIINQLRDLLLQAVVLLHKQLVHGSQLPINSLETRSFLSLLFSTSMKEVHVKC